MAIAGNMPPDLEAALPNAVVEDGHSDAEVVVLAGLASSHVLSGRAAAEDGLRLAEVLGERSPAVRQVGGDSPEAAEGSIASHEVLNAEEDSDFVAVQQVIW
jgi:hypothetical protein